MASTKGSGKGGTRGSSRSGGSGGGRKGSGAHKRSSDGSDLIATLALYSATALVGTGIGVAAYWKWGRPAVVPAPRMAQAAPVATKRSNGTDRSTPEQSNRERPRTERTAEDESPRVQVRTVKPEEQFENPDDEPGPLGNTPGNAPTDKPSNGPAEVSGANAPSPAPSTTPAQPVPPTEIRKGMSKRPEVALTFDAGSDWKPVRKILETLGSQKAQSTFFLTGEWVTKNPKSSRRIAAEGHELGNHSWDHPAFTKLSEEEIREQLKRTEAVIQETTGKSTYPFFRPPLGDRDPRVLRAVGEQGYLSVYWTLDSRDSVDRGITATQIRDRVLAGAKPGSIILLHCGSQATADALPEIMAGLKAKGLKPVTVSRLLEK